MRVGWTVLLVVLLVRAVPASAAIVTSVPLGVDPVTIAVASDGTVRVIGAAPESVRLSLVTALPGQAPGAPVALGLTQREHADAIKVGADGSGAVLVSDPSAHHDRRSPPPTPLVARAIGAGSVLGPRQRLSDGPAETGSSRLAVAQDGTALATWTEARHHDRARSAVRMPGSGFAAPVTLGPSAADAAYISAAGPGGAGIVTIGRQLILLRSGRVVARRTLPAGSDPLQAAFGSDGAAAVLVQRASAQRSSSSGLELASIAAGSSTIPRPTRFSTFNPRRLQATTLLAVGFDGPAVLAGLAHAPMLYEGPGLHTQTPVPLTAFIDALRLGPDGRAAVVSDDVNTGQVSVALRSGPGPLSTTSFPPPTEDGPALVADAVALAPDGALIVGFQGFNPAPSTAQLLRVTP